LAYYRGDYAKAQTQCEEGLGLFRELGDRFGIAGSLNSLALVACSQGNYKQAGALCEESLTISRETNDKGATARSLNVLGRAGCSLGNYERGVALLKESLTLFSEMGDKLSILRCVNSLAGIACRQMFPERAARMFGAADGLRETIGAALPLADQLELDRDVAAVRSQMGKEAFAAAWDDGRAMTLEQAIEYSLKEDTSDCSRSSCP